MFKEQMSAMFSPVTSTASSGGVCSHTVVSRRKQTMGRFIDFNVIRAGHCLARHIGGGQCSGDMFREAQENGVVR